MHHMQVTDTLFCSCDLTLTLTRWPCYTRIA